MQRKNTPPIAQILLITLFAILIPSACTIRPVAIEPAEIFLGTPGGKGAKALSYTEGDTAFVKVFDSSSRSHRIVASGSSYELSLTWNAATGRWRGLIDLSAISGSEIFLAYVINSSGQQIYRGFTTKVIDDSTRTQAISLTAGTAYLPGDPGPGGGWIYRDKGSYSDGWRYLEAARTDLSSSWSGLDLDTGYSVDGNGNATNGVSTLYTTDWYWGPNNNPPLGTDRAEGKGKDNTNALQTVDTTSSATPKVKQGKGRPTPTAVGIARRKVATTMRSLADNGRSDWDIPSSAELELMFTNIKGTSGTGFASGKYWSSSENNGISGEGIRDAWCVDFSEATASATKADRLELYRVRPSRRF